MQNKRKLYKNLKIVTDYIDKFIKIGKWKKITTYSNTYLGFSKRILGTCIVISFKSEDSTDKFPNEILVCLGMDKEERKLFKIEENGEFFENLSETLNEIIKYINQEFK